MAHPDSSSSAPLITSSNNFPSNSHHKLCCVHALVLRPYSRICTEMLFKLNCLLLVSVVRFVTRDCTLVMCSGQWLGGHSTEKTFFSQPSCSFQLPISCGIQFPCCCEMVQASKVRTHYTLRRLPTPPPLFAAARFHSSHCLYQLLAWSLFRGNRCRGHTSVYTCVFTDLNGNCRPFSRLHDSRQLQ